MKDEKDERDKGKKRKKEVQKQREEEVIEWLSGDKCLASEGERESYAVFTVEDLLIP